jgi:lipid-A-disaccharide synthase
MERMSRSRLWHGFRAAMGPVAALSQLGTLFKVFRRLSDRVETSPPDAAILIDFPDFNLRLAKRIKALKIPIIYYISPQVWAWRQGRVKQIKGLVTKMLVIFPFEERLYREAGVPVEFVGHPLMESVYPTKTKEEFCRAHALDPHRPILAILPGSRRKEIRHILPTLCDVVERMAAAKPDTQFVLPAAPNLDRGLIESIVGNHPVRLIHGDTYNALRYARAAIVASGTATLEAALLGTPEVIVYRISPVEAWFLDKFFLKVRLFGIVNIILGQEVVPELFQDKFTPELVTGAAIKLMDDVWLQSKIRANYETLRRQLRGGKVAERVAGTVAEAVNLERSQTKG